MNHYLVELLIWTVIAYLAGCIVGLILKNLFASKPDAAAQTSSTHQATASQAAPSPVAPAATGALTKPQGLSGARAGKPDDLQRISGVGPKNESILHGLGIFHFDQIAAWTAQEVAWVDDHLRFGGRIQREEWIRQAQLLAAGKEQQFMAEFGTGGLKGSDGQTHAGSHTKKN